MQVVGLDVEVQVFLKTEDAEPRQPRALDAERGVRELQEGDQAGARDEPRRVGVQPGPGLGEVIDVLVRDVGPFLLLVVAKVVQDDGDEKVEGDERTEDDESDEVEGRAVVAAALAPRAVHIAVAVGVNHAVVHDGVPSLARHHAQQQEERVAKVCKVGVLVQVLAKPNLAEEVHTQDGVHEAQQEHQRADVQQPGEGDDQGVEEHAQARQLLHNPEDPRETQDAKHGRRAAAASHEPDEGDGDAEEVEAVPSAGEVRLGVHGVQLRPRFEGEDDRE